MAQNFMPRSEVIEAVDTNDFENEPAALDDDDEKSSLMSLTSSIMEGVEENGRTYASYGQEEYGLPMDEAEMDRIDMAHAKYYILLNKKRYLAPVENAQRVLDLGCGTGIWSIDYADAHPDAEVIGVDIAPIQPKYFASNCQFQVDDIIQSWTWQENSFDFIFARDLYFSIRDFPKLIAQCFKHLKPGGYLEFESIMGILGCDDGSLGPESRYREFDGHIREAARRFGTPLEDPIQFKRWFEEAGFESVVEEKFKIPSNVWPKDKRLKMVGAFEAENMVRGLEGMSTRTFRAMGWTQEEIIVFLSYVRKEIKDLRNHAYYPFYVVYGRKPEGMK